MNIFKKIFGRKEKMPKLPDDLHILRDNKYPCDKCTIESKYCFKLHFANQTICVTKKENVNSFCSKPRRTRKPQSKI